MISLTLSNSRQNQTLNHEQGPLELGRGPKRNETPRFIVEDPFTSRDQLRIEAVSTSTLRIENLGGPVSVSEGGELPAGHSREVTLPVRVTFGYSTVDILGQTALPQDRSSLHTIAAPLRQEPTPDDSRSLIDLGESPDPATLARWFERLLAVQRAVAGSGEFYGETARAVVELVGLDRGVVLLRTNGEWNTAASFPARSGKPRNVSLRVLAEVLQQRRTFFQTFTEDDWSASLVGVEAVVASPIFDEHDEIVGAVYGSRDLRSASLGRQGIQPLEAQVVQLLAAAVSSGLARLQGEAEAARTRVQFEQFFSPELAKALENDPSLLEGQEREVTVLFCDLRGFSGVSEILGPRRTYSLLSDIMDRFTSRIMDHAGVIIDYYGDGLAAMWNAPAQQADHVARACRAALAILDELPALNQTWSETIGKTLRVGIGIDTGKAQVGNAGSRRRIKYGPRGHTVNLASRIENSTKLLGVHCLVSAHAREQLGDEFPLRRLCCARVSGVSEPVDVFELPAASPSEEWRQLCEAYEKALSCYEQADFAECLRICADLAVGVGRGDAPTSLLAQKASKQLAAPGSTFESIYQLDTKS